MKRVLLTLTWILAATVICSAQTTFYFPQIADGIQVDGITWKTTIFITNPAAAGSPAANGAIAFTKSNGFPFTLSFIDSSGVSTGTGSTLSFSLSPGQTRKFVSSGANAIDVGFATLISSGTVNGTAVFSQFTAGGVLISEGGVPSAATYARQLIFVDTQGGFDTGVAYANPNSVSATITLQLLNTEGVAVIASAQRALAGNTHTAGYIRQNFFPTAPPFAGTMLISSSTPLAAVALRFSPGLLFTTLPPIPIASLLSPALEWLEKRPWVQPFSALAKLLGGLQFSIG